MEKSRLATYAVGALLAIAAAVVYLATKNVELTAMLSTAAAGVIGYAKQHVADKVPATEKLGPPAPGTPVICALILGSLLLSGPARADIDLDSIVPRLTKCWGTTCVTPAAAVDAVLFDLQAKKWQGGVTNLGGGVALLFAADTPWASGISARVTGVLSQTGPSFAMPSIGVVVARYIEVAYSRRFAEGPDTDYVSLAGVVPFDLFTKATIPERAQAARKWWTHDGGN